MQPSSSAIPVVVLLTLLAASSAFAQEAAPNDSGASSQPGSEPRQPKASAMGPQRGNRVTLAFGPSVVFWPPNPDEDAFGIRPGFAFQTRQVFLAGGVFGFEWVNDIVFHDFQAMADGYRWYFDKPDTEDERRWQAVKIGALWPALFLIPFGGANYTTGGGLIIFTSPSSPAAYFDVGANLNLFLRLSDPQFIADFGIGAYGGGGYDFSQNIGLGFRLNWGTPLIHNIANATTGSIVTLIATLNINFN